MIFACAHEKGKEWDEVLHYFEIRLRSTANKSNELSPFQIIFGFTPRLVKVQIFSSYFASSQEKERARKEITKLNELNEHSTSEIKLIRVAEKKPGIYSKRFDGLGRVIEEKNNNSYEIEIESKRFIRHEDNIKLSKAVKKISGYPCTSIISAINLNNEEKIHN